MELKTRGRGKGSLWSLALFVPILLGKLSLFTHRSLVHRGWAQVFLWRLRKQESAPENGFLPYNSSKRESTIVTNLPCGVVVLGGWRSSSCWKGKEACPSSQMFGLLYLNPQRGGSCCGCYPKPAPPPQKKKKKKNSGEKKEERKKQKKKNNKRSERFLPVTPHPPHPPRRLVLGSIEVLRPSPPQLVPRLGAASAKKKKCLWKLVCRHIYIYILSYITYLCMCVCDILIYTYIYIYTHVYIYI